MEKNEVQEESKLVKNIEWIAPIVVLGGLYLFGEIFTLILISAILFMFALGEIFMSDETKERRLKMWGKTNIFYILFKLMTFQKPLDKKDEKWTSRIFIGLVVIGIITGIVFMYLGYLLP